MAKRIGMVGRPEHIQELARRHSPRLVHVLEQAKREQGRLDVGPCCPVCDDAQRRRAELCFEDIVEVVEYGCGEIWGRDDEGNWRLVKWCGNARFEALRLRAQLAEMTTGRTA